METLELLQKAFERLGPNGENWTQGAMGRNYAGMSCGFTPEAGAIKWCTTGSIFLETDTGWTAQQAIDLLRNCAGLPLKAQITTWNDEHPWPEIRLVWEAAIEKAKLLKAQGLA